MLIVLALVGLALIAHLLEYHRDAASRWHLLAKVLGGAALTVMAALVGRYMRRRCR